MKNSAVLLTAAMVAISGLPVAKSASAVSPTCRDYYLKYLEEATSPPPSHSAPVYPAPPPVVIIITEPVHYHDHYPECRKDPGSDSDSEDGLIFAGILAGLSTTTTLAEDAQLQNTRDIVNIIDQAQMGDGPDLRSFTGLVQSKLGNRVVSVQQVANAVVRDNANMEFCRAGDLDTKDELATRIASEI